MRTVALCLLIFFISVPLSVHSQTNPEICTRDVCFKGKLESGDKKPYEAFYGIPFAEPPVGDLRFKNPIAKVHRDDLWDATYPRNDCMQIRSSTASEDCLYLNIYRPVTKKTLPVLVFIHGGSFLSGNALPEHVGPKYIIDSQQVILVTIQYRLGMFGFLSSGDKNCQGNFGLKDQNLALKWIKENIKNFGGDSKSITVAGQSAGSASVHYQIMSPQSDGLFHKAILFSGSALAFWTIIRDPLAQFKEVAQYANMQLSTTVDTNDVVTHLRTLTAEKILDLSTKVFQFSPIVGAFRPCIEDNWRGAFITEDPEYIWKSGRYQQRPLLITHVAVEAAFFYDYAFKESVIQTINANLDQSLALSAEIPLDLVPYIKSFYFNNQPISLSNSRRLLDFFSDVGFMYPLYKTVKDYLQYANLKKNPVYLAKFDFNSTNSWANVFIQSDVYLGQAHGDDMMYLFDIPVFGLEFNTPSAEYDMRVETVDLAVTFAKTGHIPQTNKLYNCNRRRMYNYGYCEYAVFKRDKSKNPNTVRVDISNKFDLKMVKLYQKIDRAMKNN